MFIDKEELVISKESGFVSIWPVREKYEIKNGMLIGSGETKNYRLPMAYREIAWEAAKLHKKDEKTLLDFAHRFGHFGYSKLVPVDKRTEGDPLKWIWIQAQKANLTLQLLTALNQEDEQAALKVIETLKVDEEVILDWDFNELPFGNIGVGGKITHSTALEFAITILKELLNENVKGIRRKAFLTKDPYKIKSYFHFDALIQVVFWQLFDAAENGEFRRCKQCQAPFIARDKRQRFCPARYGEKESRCTIAYRVRRYRDKEKAEA